MKLLLLLGVVFFGVEAESQEIQKLLALARQLNQSLGSLAGHAVKTRRLQASAPNANCRAACEGIQCAWDDTQAIANQINGGNQLAALSATGDLLGAVCLHETAMTCAVGSADCGWVLSTSLPLAPCVCDACANFPKLYEDMGPLITAIQAMASGETVTEEQTDSLLTALCPMASVLECLESNSAVCSSALASMGSLGSALNQVATMKSQCAAAGKSTVYATNYIFTSPTCESTTTSTGVGEDTTSTGAGEDVAGANGLVQLNLLAGSFSLFSILN